MKLTNFVNKNEGVFYSLHVLIAVVLFFMIALISPVESQCLYGVILIVTFIFVLPAVWNTIMQIECNWSALSIILGILFGWMYTMNYSMEGGFRPSYKCECGYRIEAHDFCPKCKKEHYHYDDGHGGYG